MVHVGHSEPLGVPHTRGAAAETPSLPRKGFQPTTTGGGHHQGHLWAELARKDAGRLLRRGGLPACPFEALPWWHEHTREKDSVKAKYRLFRPSQLHHSATTCQIHIGSPSSPLPLFTSSTAGRHRISRQYFTSRSHRATPKYHRTTCATLSHHHCAAARKSRKLPCSGYGV